MLIKIEMPLEVVSCVISVPLRVSFCYPQGLCNFFLLGGDGLNNKNICKLSLLQICITDEVFPCSRPYKTSYLSIIVQETH